MGSVSEDEIRAVLMDSRQLTVRGLVLRFKERLQSKEDMVAFRSIVVKIAKIQKIQCYIDLVVLKDNDLLDSLLSSELTRLPLLPPIILAPQESKQKETDFSPFTNSRQKNVTNEDPVESVPSGSGSFIGKRKLNESVSQKTSCSCSKKLKPENALKAEPAAASASSSSVVTGSVTEDEIRAFEMQINQTLKAQAAAASASSSSVVTGSVTEDEIRAFLMEKKQVTPQDLVNRFKAMLKTKEERNAFADIMKKISKIQKSADSPNIKIVVLKEI